MALCVKAQENLQSKSLKSYLSKNPDLYGIRFSMSPYREQERLVNVPLYCVREFMDDVKRQVQWLKL